MQLEAPEAFDLSKESDETLALYGLKRGQTGGFAWQCLVARRLCERGVRFIELIDTGSSGNWDSHGDMADHGRLAKNVDGPTAGLLRDLRRRGLLDETCLTVTGEALGRALDWWEGSERRTALRERLRRQDGVDPDDVIMDPERARERGLTSTVTFPRGNLAPEGAVIKSTAIDPSVVDPDGVYRKTGPARVYTTERAAIAAIKSTGPERIKPGDVLVLICRGPLGAGMEEIYQITSALKHLSWGKQVAVLTDARFSGVSTGACIGHVGPEALAGGPIGRLRDGDVIEIEIDRAGHAGRRKSQRCGRRFAALADAPRPGIAAARCRSVLSLASGHDALSVGFPRRRADCARAGTGQSAHLSLDHGARCGFRCRSIAQRRPSGAGEGQ